MGSLPAAVLQGTTEVIGIIPEPTSVLLLGSGIMTLALWRLRRRPRDSGVM